MVDRVVMGLRRGWRVVFAAPAVAVYLAVGSGLAAAGPASVPAAGAQSAQLAPGLVGDYLAGRDAQATRDFPAAAAFYEKALALDPKAPELISRSEERRVGK